MSRVLLVEDEMQLAMMVEDILQDAGYEVCKSGRMPHALALLSDQTFDAAILDVNLAGVPVFPLAEALRLRGIPFVFASGYGRDGVAPEYRDYPILQKPYLPEQLLIAVSGLVAGQTPTVPSSNG